MLMTHSPTSHLNDDVIRSVETQCGLSLQVLPLAAVSSERQLLKAVESFYHDEAQVHKVLVVQCDPIVCRQTLINQALHVCDQVHAAAPVPCAWMGDLRAYRLRAARQ